MARVFTVPPDVPFLDALARAILGGGFPHDGIAAPTAETLPGWTILVPTRRAARALEHALLKASGRPAMLLPAIAPIGDLDDRDQGLDDLDLPEAISPVGREFLLTRLIGEWAEVHDDQALARELRRSPVQTQALARSLGELLDTAEIEETTLDGLADIFLKRELALHREAILGFLDIIREELPKQLAALGLMGPMARRGKLIDRAAARLSDAPPAAPVIVAGSTGTIPATRRLIEVIASLDHGAAVLPGLDQDLDAAAWDQVAETHPQFALKLLLEALGMARGDVPELHGTIRSAEGQARIALASEAMRPKESAGAWPRAIAAGKSAWPRACTGLTAIEAANRAEEALIIALAMRETIEIEGRTAALITPDRPLALRVQAELARWNTAAADSAGEPLVATPPGSFAAALIEAALAGFAALELAVLARHPGLAGDGEAARVFELAVLRRSDFRGGLADLPGRLKAARAEAGAGSHIHPALRRLHEDQWRAAEDFADRLAAALAPLAECAEAPRCDLNQVVDHIISADARLTAFDAADEASRAFAALLTDLHDQARYFPAGPFVCAATAVLRRLRQTPVHRAPAAHPRLAIYGLLEARMMRADLIILGGLNEAIWPALPDPGPWLNRPMRQDLALRAPERDIGLTAHDFVQALGNGRVLLTWSKRLGNDPAVPSRWILRLKTLLEGAGLWDGVCQSPLPALARGLDRVPSFTPLPKPRPCPRVSARPRQLSVTAIETLIRDPYAIYARRILRLEPLEPIVRGPDAALRGNIVHQALADFHQLHPTKLPAQALAALVDAGERAFAPHLGDPDVASFWRPRFTRIALWFLEQDAALRAGVREIKAEVAAEHAFPLADGTFTLTARADRIDVLESGQARIVDFKTGKPPSWTQVDLGWNPQLTLEAALLGAGAFMGIEAMATSELVYLRLTGGEPPGELQLWKKSDVMAIARRHLEELQDHLLNYANPAEPYLPRRRPEREDDASDYDHLSRWREWRLSGEAR